jgi:hypothetical protein
MIKIINKRAYLVLSEKTVCGYMTNIFYQPAFMRSPQNEETINYNYIYMQNSCQNIDSQTNWKKTPQNRILISFLVCNNS